VVHNTRPAAATKLGIDASLRTGRPRLIHAAIVGFGNVGPYAGRPAYDHVLQALSGFAARQAVGGEPSLIRQGVIDKATGYLAAQAITAALFERTNTGVGQALEVCMLDLAVAMLWPDGMMNHTMIDPDPALVRPSIARGFRVTATADGHL